MTDLIERIATALEKIADNTDNGFAGSDMRPTIAEDLVVVEERSEESDNTEETASYAELAKAGNREALLSLCKDMSIAVPPRTRTDTLVKMLEDADMKSGGTAPPVEEVVDPFADPAAPPELTPEQVREVLTEVHAKEGVPRVVEILKKFGGGVTALKDLQPAFFKAVYDEAKK